jgi:hypothetical protein
VVANGHLRCETSGRARYTERRHCRCAAKHAGRPSNLIERRHECATHVVFCEADQFRGVFTAENALSPPAACRETPSWIGARPSSVLESTKRAPHGAPSATANLRCASRAETVISLKSFLLTA